jgi:hypothetical protein
MVGDSESTFTRRKFTITETLDETLAKLAQQHYQGNISLCIRAAIEDHRKTLNGTGDAQTMRGIQKDLERLADRQDSLSAAIDELDSSDTNSREVAKPNRDPSDGGTSYACNVARDAIREAERPVRIEDLQERLELPLSELQPALGTLIDRGAIVRTDEHPSRFQLAGYHRTQGKHE